MNIKKVNENTFFDFWLRHEPTNKSWFIKFKYKQYTRSTDNLLTFLQEECY